MSQIPINLFLYNGHGMSIPDNFVHQRVKYNSKITLKKNQFVIMFKDMEPLTGAGWLQDQIWKLVDTTTPKKFAELCNNLRENSFKNSPFGFFGSPESNTECPNLSLSYIPQDSDDPLVKSEILKFGDKLVIPRYGLFSFPISEFLYDSDPAQHLPIEDLPKNIEKKKKILAEKLTSLGVYGGLRTYFEYRPIPKSTFIGLDTIEFIKKDVEDFYKNQKYQEQNNIIPVHPDTYIINYLSDFVNGMGDRPFIIICNVCRSCALPGDYSKVRKLIANNIELFPSLINELYTANVSATKLDDTSPRLPKLNFDILMQQSSQPKTQIKTPRSIIIEYNGKKYDLSDPIQKEAYKSAITKSKYLKYKAKYLELKNKLNAHK